MSHIAYYVHHVGWGHAARALALAAASPLPVTLMSELDLGAAWGASVVLPPDAPVPACDHGRGDPTADGWLHWAPIAPEQLGPRARRLVEELTAPGTIGVVTDVSVEAAVLARLCGLPVVTVDEMGRRSDRPHQLGRALASGVLAPFPAALADPAVDRGGPDVFHAGFLPRPLGAAGVDRDRARRRLGLGAGPIVLVATGSGGTRVRAQDVADLADRLPDVTVIAVGDHLPPTGTDLVRWDGWVPDLGGHLAAADVVVAAAGASLVAEVASAGRSLVCVPEPRPFAEQEERARRLRALGLASVVDGWDDADRLAAAVGEQLSGRGPRWDDIDLGPAPAATMAWVLERLDRATVGAS